MKKIPVILDTDIGTDVDDTWALAMMLKSPELDVKLITTSTGDTMFRAKIVAKMLEIAKRTDIPIGIGTPLEEVQKTQEPWVKDYDISSYKGIVYKDGVKALIDTIMNSKEELALICIGPMPNISKALEIEPRIASKCRFVGMFGSVRKGYEGSDKISAEYNVKAYIQECKKVFTAPWDMTITPLDTCGLIYLQGEKFKKVLNCKDPLIMAMMENDRIWVKENKMENKLSDKSKIIYDTVAIYLAFSEKLLKMEKLGIRVSDDGFTLIDDNAKKINVATEWKDLPAFEDFLVERLVK